MIRRGAVFGHGSLSEGYEAGNVATELAGHAFSSSERGNQVSIAVTKYHQLVADLRLLQSRGGKDNPMTAMLNKLNIKLQDPVKTRISEHGNEKLLKAAMTGKPVQVDLINEALHRTVRDRAFPMVLNTKPIWYDTQPLVKILAQFKTWPIQQTKMIWNDVIKYTIKTGDMRRLAGFLVGTLIAGEIYNIARDLLYDKDESIASQLTKDDKKIVKAILEDLIDGGGVGMLADFTYGIVNWATGVTANTGVNVKDAIGAIIQRPSMTPAALRRLVEKEVTPVRQVQKLIDKIDRKLVNKKNLTKDYFKVRSWAWDHKEGYLRPGTLDKAKKNALDVFFGKPSYSPGKNTLNYQMTARQLTVGDIGDAADYIEPILKAGGKPNQIASSLRSNYSPFGHIKKAEQGKFINSLPQKERKAAIDAQKQWERNLKEAMREAIKQTRKK